MVSKDFPDDGIFSPESSKQTKSEGRELGRENSLYGVPELGKRLVPSGNKGKACVSRINQMRRERV